MEVYMHNIIVTRTTNAQKKPEKGEKLPFGACFSDHMFIMDYDAALGWHSPRIVPYAPISLDPAAMCLHYGQEVFEGMKAYRAEDGRLLLFRPEENFRRLNRSNERICIPYIDEALCLEALNQLVDIDQDWIPDSPDSSLYIRPFIVATEARLGVKPSDSYLFMIITSPSGPYYEQGIKPVKIYVESLYVRAVRGGTGMAKAGGNYASSLKAQMEAHKLGYSQVLWLDGIERKYVEEVGAMNIFFVIGDEVLTPELSGSILDGITRKSVIELLRLNGYTVTERRVSIEDIAQAYDDGLLREVFGTGTAAVISPVGELRWNYKTMIINNGEIGAVSRFLYDELTGIQWGRRQGPEGWSVEVQSN